MRYWACTLGGLVLIAGAIAAASDLIYELVRIGSCANGGAYVVAHTCPAGSGLKVLGVVLSIFVVPFAGLGLLSQRGGSGGAGDAGSVGALWFALLFACMGGAALVAGLGPAAPHETGLKSAAAWLGGTFIAVGAPMAIFALFTTTRRRPAVTLPSPGTVSIAGLGALATRPAPAPATPPPGTPDLAGRLRELDSLRASGLITDAERDARRAAMLKEL